MHKQMVKNTSRNHLVTKKSSIAYTDKSCEMTIFNILNDILFTSCNSFSTYPSVNPFSKINNMSLQFKWKVTNANKREVSVVGQYLFRIGATTCTLNVWSNTS